MKTTPLHLQAPYITFLMHITKNVAVELANPFEPLAGFRCKSKLARGAVNHAFPNQA